MRAVSTINNAFRIVFILCLVGGVVLPPNDSATRPARAQGQTGHHSSALSSCDCFWMAFSISSTLFIACFRTLGAKPCACSVQYTRQRLNSSTPIVSKRFSKSRSLKKYATRAVPPTSIGPNAGLAWFGSWRDDSSSGAGGKQGLCRAEPPGGPHSGTCFVSF